VTYLILARHGETDWNRDGIWQGHGDPPLNHLGRQQAAALAERMIDVEIEALYSSDLRRAHETADYLSRSTALPVVSEPGLREMDVGSWTGLTAAEIEERFPGMEYHDGESREAFSTRAISTLQGIASRNHGRCALVVTHGGVVRALQRHMYGEPLAVLGNCETYAVRYEDERFAGVD
jgi:2,3-bisphosphoglycerate-dependent phosphoglycerate mutase